MSLKPSECNHIHVCNHSIFVLVLKQFRKKLKKKFVQILSRSSLLISSSWFISSFIQCDTSLILSLMRGLSVAGSSKALKKKLFINDVQQFLLIFDSHSSPSNYEKKIKQERQLVIRQKTDLTRLCLIVSCCGCQKKMFSEIC